MLSARNVWWEMWKVLSSEWFLHPLWSMVETSPVFVQTFCHYEPSGSFVGFLDTTA